MTLVYIVNSVGMNGMNSLNSVDNLDDIGAMNIVPHCQIHYKNKNGIITSGTSLYMGTSISSKDQPLGFACMDSSGQVG